MKRSTVFLVAALICALIAIGCSSGNPMAPSDLTGSAVGNVPHGSAQTHLWGFCDVYIDIPTQTATANLNRQAMFTANVVTFINSKPANLMFEINDTKPGSDFVDVDIDVTINHPFPGLPQYNGYDVRGVFMGDGSATLEYNPALVYPVLGLDQSMLADPVDGFGAPDGYTRWYNLPEFSTGGMPLFQYTPGAYASKGFSGTSTLNPYKYFADGLGVTDDLWTWLGPNAAQNGVFSSGASNTRNYYLRFPNSKGVKFGYAVIADWNGTEPENHPANAPEAIALNVVDASTVYYVSPGDNGGKLVLDISVWDWDAKVSGGVMTDYRLFVESTVLSGLHQFNTSEMTPIGGGEHYSTYHVEIPANSVTGLDGNEYWVIGESPNANYKNDFGTTNLCGDDPVAALFRYDLHVLTAKVNQKPICDLEIDPSTPVPAEDFSPVPVKFDASGSSDPDGDTLVFAWDFDGDGVYDEPVDDSFTGTPSKPTHNYLSDYTGKVYVKVNDGHGGEAICSVDVQVTAHPSKNLPLRPGVACVDLGIDPSNGDLWIVYSDCQQWKYTLPGWYADGTYRYTVAGGGYYIQFMDVASGGYAHCMTLHPYYSPTEWLMNNTGGIIVGMGWGGADNHFRDCTNYPSTGTYADNLIMFMGYFHTYYSQNITMVRGYLPPSYSVATMYTTETWVPNSLTGINVVYQDYLVAIDSSVDGEDFWTLEAPDYYAAAFKVSGGGYLKTQVYDNSYFGTGTEQTGDTCWTANVVDMSRDKTGRFHVLDKIDDVAAIKVFTGSATGGTAHGHYGDGLTISGIPIAIDGDDFGGRMFVLHGSDATGYFLSIFQPSEFPN